jgi:hypothetical protein
VTIKTDVPGVVDWEELTWNGPDKKRLAGFFKQMEFRTLSLKYLDVDPSGQSDLFGGGEEAAASTETEVNDGYRRFDNDLAGVIRVIETGNVGGPSAYATTDRPMAPDHTLGVQMKITRKALKQTGSALEQAVRRDISGAMAQEMDRVVFLGTGANGQPLGVVTGAATYGITATDVDALADWAAFRAAVTAFMVANAATGPAAIRALTRPELWDYLDGQLIEGTAVTEWDRLVRHIPVGNIAMTSHGLAAPAGEPLATSALLTTTKNGVAPIFVGTWGGIDLIRDPYSDAQSGGLRLTALATMDLTVARPVQLRLLNGLELEVDEG